MWFIPRLQSMSVVHNLIEAEQEYRKTKYKIRTINIEYGTFSSKH